jgi:hypothetical protein
VKALLFSDWCTLKGVAKSYPAPALVIAAVATFAGIQDVEPVASAIAMHVHSSIVSVGLMMFSFFGFFSLFGNDEREGWEAVRLSLPVTRRTVVRARYLALLILFGIVAVAVNLVGLVMGAVTSFALHGQIGFMPLSEGVLLTGLFCMVYLVYLGLTTPIVFKMGISKARIYFSLPFMLCLLLTFEPVKDTLQQIPLSLDEVSHLLGSPLLLLALGLVVAAAIYGASMLVSERIYAARDF